MILTVLKNIIFWFLGIIFLTIPFLFLFIWKCLMILIVKIWHPSWEAMRVRDTMTIADSIYSKPYLNVGLVLEVNGIIDLGQFREHFSKVLLEPKDPQTGRPLFGNLYANMSRFGGVCFKRRLDTNSVDLKTQIYEELLAENETISEFIVKFFYAPHEETKPLWKVVLLQPKNDDGNTKIFFKLHHSMGDGYSLIYLFDKLTDNSTPNLVAGFGESFYDKAKLIAGAPATMTEFGKNLGEIKSPFSMSGVDTQIVYNCFSLDLNSVKKVRKATGVHIAPILFTLMGGVVRRLLLESRIAEADLPPHTFSGHSLPWPSHPRNKMCNEWTVGMFKVPIKEKNSLERLRISDADYKEFLNSGISRLTKRLFAPIMSLLPVHLAEKMGSAESPISTSWSAIVAGNDYVILGKSVQHIFPFVGFTMPRMALVTFSLSHSNKIDVTIGANRECIPDEAKLAQVTTWIEEELDSLIALCESAVPNVTN